MIRAGVVLAALLAAPAAALAAEEGDPEAGQRIYKIRCQLCHPVDPDTGHDRGPNLHGVFGREAGAPEDYKFSAAHARAELVWDAETLDRYLADFDAVIPGTPKYLPGITGARDRADVIAYLKTLR